MVWTAPMTAVDTAQFSAQEYNLYIRDNLLEMAPAKTTAVGQYFVSSGMRQIAAWNISDNFNSAAGTTTATAFTSTLSGSPGTNVSITVTTGVSALIWFSAAMSNSTLNAQCSTSIAVSGASHIPASNHWRTIHDGKAAGNVTRTMGLHRFAAELTAGSNTFTMQYKVASNTGTFSRRYLAIMPL